MRFTLKQIVVLSGFTCAILVCLFFLFNYLTSGKVIISSDKNAVITLTTQGGIQKSKASGVLSKTVKSGTYVVIVSNRNQSIKKTITVKARKVTNYTVKPPLFSNPEPVTGSKTQYIFSDGQTLNYYDTNIAQFVTIGASGQLSYITGMALTNIKWADANYGIGIASDGNMYVINNNSIYPLATPQNYKPTTATGYGINSKRQVYLSIGNNIYLGGESGYKKIYTAGSSLISIYPTKDNFAVITTVTAGKSEPEVIATIKTVTNDGTIIANRQTEASDDLSAHINATWSPDGTKLLITNAGSSSSIYDSHLKKVADLPDNTIPAVTWFDSNKLLYSIDNQVWLYDISSKESSNVAQLPDGSAINEISASTDGSYVYISSGTAEHGTTYRFGINQTHGTDILYKLGIFLPANLKSCNVNYINFTQPTIVLMPLAGITDTCRQDTDSLFKDSAIDTSGLSFYTSNILSTAD